MCGQVPTIRIENVVATATLGGDVDLKAVVKARPDVEYRPEIFPGLILKMGRPKATLIIFKNGKIICTGANSEGEAYKTIMRAVKMLAKCKAASPGDVKIVVRNIVASGNMGKPADIERAARVFKEAMYEPEIFPGLICRVNNPRAAILLFSNGNYVCAGTKSEKDAYRAVENFRKKLEENGLL
ncbi:MAG: TATA box-binding protein [Nitrososphaerota archaeon]